MALGYASNFFDLQARALPRRPDLGAARRRWASRASSSTATSTCTSRPFPALLRIPVLLTTDEFDGRLTLLSMALALSC